MDTKKIPTDIPDGPQIKFDLVASPVSIVWLRQFISPGPPPTDLIEFRVPQAELRLPTKPWQHGLAIVYVRAKEMPPSGVAILQHMLNQHILNIGPNVTGFQLSGTGSYTVDNMGFTVFVDQQSDILFFQ